MDGENSARLKNAVDKGITSIVSRDGGWEMPPASRGDSPLAPDPHHHGAPPARISPAAEADLGKLAPDKAARVREYLRKD